MPQSIPTPAPTVASGAVRTAMQIGNIAAATATSKQGSGEKKMGVLMHKCRRCTWGTWISKKLVFCMLPECAKDEEDRRKQHAAETETTLQTARVPGANA